MCKQDRYYTAMPGLAHGFYGSSCCNVFCFVYIFVLYSFEDYIRVINIMQKLEDTVMVLVMQ
jgi:hypothetical protein